MVKVFALYAEGHGFNSCTGIFPDFFCGYFHAEVSLLLSKFNCSALGWISVPSFPSCYSKFGLLDV